MAEIQRAPEAAPKQEIKTDFNQMVETALADKRLNREERGEILSVIDKMNSEKETINSQTVAKLEAFLKGAQGGSDFEKTKTVLLEKIGANKQISESGPVSTQDSLQKGEEIVQSVSVETTPTNTPTQTPNNTTEKESGMIDKTGKIIRSGVDTVKNIFSSKIDLSTLPETDKKIVEELQTSGFTLTPIEGKSSTYELDMLGIGDKSTLTIQGEKMKFTTNRVMENGTQKEFEFTDLRDAKEKLTQINEYIKVSFEIKPLDEKYHKDSQEQDRYDALSKQKAGLEKNLGIAPPAPAPAPAPAPVPIQTTNILTDNDNPQQEFNKLSQEYFAESGFNHSNKEQSLKYTDEIYNNLPDSMKGEFLHQKARLLSNPKGLGLTFRTPNEKISFLESNLLDLELALILVNKITNKTERNNKLLLSINDKIHSVKVDLDREKNKRIIISDSANNEFKNLGITLQNNSDGISQKLVFSEGKEYKVTIKSSNGGSITEDSDAPGKEPLAFDQNTKHIDFKSGKFMVINRDGSTEEITFTRKIEKQKKETTRSSESLDTLSLPENRHKEYSFTLKNGEKLLVTSDKQTRDYNTFKMSIGNRDIPIDSVERMRDGGTTRIFTKEGELYVPTPFRKEAKASWKGEEL